MMKTCVRCEEHLPLDQFKNPRTGKSRGRYCYVCYNARSMEQYYARKATEPEVLRTIRRTHQMKALFGITLEDYETMRLAQNGLCAICHRPESAKDVNGQTRRLCVDHDHGTGVVRALLCSGCNTSIGLLGEDVDRIIAAAVYLTQHKTPAGA